MNILGTLTINRPFHWIIAATALALAGCSNAPSTQDTSNTSAQNQALAVTIAYQTGVDPAKVAQANGEYETATEANITWRKFDSGADVIAALASGDVAIGNIGSSPLAAATSRHVPIELFFVASVLGQSESLVVNDKVAAPQDLVGKKIAVPFVSTTHYSLLSALKHWGIDSGSLQIVNLRPPEIAGAWARGDIDGAYVWEPVLSTLKQTGKVLVSSEEVGKWGAPTYDVWVVRKDFAQNHPDFVRQFAAVTAKANDRYLNDPQAFVANEDNIRAIAQLTGSKPEDIAVLLGGNLYLNLQEQAQLLDTTAANDIKNTAQFLKEQGKVEQVLDSYADYVTARFVNQSE